MGLLAKESSRDFGQRRKDHPVQSHDDDAAGYSDTGARAAEHPAGGKKPPGDANASGAVGGQTEAFERSGADGASQGWFNMIRRVVAAAVSLALLSLLTLGAPANGQSSIGGNIGDDDRSISGVQEPMAPSQLPNSPELQAIKPMACDRVVGEWSWFNGGTVIIRSDGTVDGGPYTAKWSCINGKIIMVWSHGYKDRLALSPDGNHLEGTNGHIRVFGNRK
jgi:hypothetical protein